MTNGPTVNQLLAGLGLSLLIRLATWAFALWNTGARLDYRPDPGSGFVALRLTPRAGVSWQWSEQGQSVWFWTPEQNWRVWGGE